MTDTQDRMNRDTLFLSADDEHIIKAINITIAQIDMTMTEATESVDQIMQAMIVMNNCISYLREIVLATPSEVEGDFKTSLNTLDDQLHVAVIAFQFFDRLAQRISHAEETLAAVSSLIQEPTNEHPFMWKRLQEKMKTVYSADQERQLHSVLAGKRAGGSVKDGTSDQGATEYDNIELF